MPTTENVANKLINEKSPYLLQHAYNPVQWYPWCKEIFAKAKEDNKPVFLSIGYSTCHWCHVMAHESFEDKEIADILNKHFISIKVDREERPDVDSVYMSVCQALYGHGGWPLTILMTPEQQPFFAATYLPKTARGGQLGLKELLLQVTKLWTTEPDQLISRGKDILSIIGQEEEEDIDLPSINELLSVAVTQFKQSFDHKNGGFHSAPKFPTPHNLLFLMRYYHSYHDFDTLAMAETTLKQMYKGGIFDHIGGGFSRYSTDAYWLVPHFEKMLYDNALLLFAYLECFQITGEPLYQSIAERILQYVARELTDQSGGFFCGQDADSEGVEGKYYVFTPEEILKVLGMESGEHFNEQFDITPEGNFEGKNIPNLLKNPHPFLYSMEDLCHILYEYRLHRNPLHKDDKVLTSWNGLMIAAYSKAARVLKKEEILAAAMKADAFIKNTLTDENGRLYVRYRDGECAGEGKIDDYTFFALAQLELYETTYEVRYLDYCIRLMNHIRQYFLDEEHGGCYLYSAEGEQLITRPKEVYDGAIPSGNSVYAYLLVKLFRLTGESSFRELSTKQLTFLMKQIQSYPSGYSFSLMAFLEENTESMELICVLRDESQISSLKTLLHNYYLPNLSVIIKTHDNEELLSDLAPFTKDYSIPSEDAKFYLCVNHSCLSPVTDLKSLEKLLKENS